jgi:alpha-tubulin suppressor-like RCC1 family protein
MPASFLKTYIMKRTLLIFLLVFLPKPTIAQCYESLKFGGAHTIGIKQDGTLWGWGFADFGQLSTANLTEPNPVQITTISNIQNFYLGIQNTFIIKNDGTLWGIGSNIYGSLGVNSVAESVETFQQITTTNNWLKVSPSYLFTLALKTDGTIWAWGQDDINQTGNPPASESQTTPIQIGTANDWIDVATSTNSTAFALKADGTIWGWGFNIGSLLVSSSSVVGVNTPIQINGVNGFVKMSAGGSHILAQKADGTLWAWGTGPGRGVGDGSPTIGSVPLQISTDTWSFFSGGTGTSFGIKTDGTLWTWGLNTNGQLGLGTETNHSVPVQIGTDTNWATVQARKYATTMATKTDGTVWYWGTNYFGEFGNGQDYLEVYFTTPQLSPNVCVTNLSTPSFEQKDNVRLYPNPVQNRLFIDIQDKQQYQIYSVLGTKISEGMLAVGSGIDCSSFTSGVYFISLTDSLGNSSTQKFVKQ